MLFKVAAGPAIILQVMVVLLNFNVSGMIRARVEASTVGKREAKAKVVKVRPKVHEVVLC